MKKWFLNLPSEQRKEVYKTSIIVSVVLFFGFLVNPPLFPLWVAALVAVLAERKIIKEQDRKDCLKIDEKAEQTPAAEEIAGSGSTEEIVAADESIEQAAASAGFTVTIKTEYVEREPVGELSHLDFGKPAGELGCFLNYRIYQVTGTLIYHANGTSERKRRSKRVCTGENADQAIEKASALGLLPPFEVETIEHDPPTERQLNYLKDLGVFIPDGITKEDASCMISRATEEDSVEGPTPEIIALASGFKLEYSAFIGNSGLFRYIINGTNKRDRAALYAYAVRQSVCGGSFGNMLDAPDLPRFYAFADQILADPALMRSLENRSASDFKKPQKGTAIYKAAITYLTSGSISNEK